MTTDPAPTRDQVRRADDKAARRARRPLTECDMAGQLKRGQTVTCGTSRCPTCPNNNHRHNTDLPGALAPGA